LNELDAHVTPVALRPLYEAARLRLARMRVDGSASLATAFQRATELAARILSASRVGIWLFDDRREAIVASDLFELATGTHTAGARITVQQFPIYFQALEERREVAAHDALAHPVTRELAEPYLRPLGIASMLDAPIFREGRVAGVVCHEHVGPARKWTREERDFAGSVADMVSGLLEQAARRDAEAEVAALSERLAESSKMEALGRLAAGVAHDFRSYLTPVVALADKVTASPAATPEIASQARRILQAAERAAALAEQLLSFGRGEAPSTDEIDAVATLRGLAPTLRDRLGATCSLDLDLRVAAGPVRIASSALEQIVLNLGVNACDAMGGAGHVAVSVDEQRIDLVGAAPQRFVVIAVVDSGPGMDETTRARIFEPFFTTKEAGRGHGLGLAIVYRLVSEHGGWIDVETVAGNGSTFRIFLPRSETPAEAAAPPRANGEAPSRLSL
jgi:two-component system cell cycle sensor histidine kinase/response regulator CckA